METFPQYVKLTEESYAEQPDTAVRRTEVESGPSKQAQISSRVMVSRPIVGMVLSRADLNSWKAWFRSIGRGAAWFNWNDPIDRQKKLARIKGGLVVYQLAGASGEIWRISMTLETWE